VLELRTEAVERRAVEHDGCAATICTMQQPSTHAGVLRDKKAQAQVMHQFAMSSTPCMECLAASTSSEMANEGVSQ
jgi:hypothetical protein